MKEQINNILKLLNDKNQEHLHSYASFLLYKQQKNVSTSVDLSLEKNERSHEDCRLNINIQQSIIVFQKTQTDLVFINFNGQGPIQKHVANSWNSFSWSGKFPYRLFVHNQNQGYGINTNMRYHLQMNIVSAKLNLFYKDFPSLQNMVISSNGNLAGFGTASHYRRAININSLSCEELQLLLERALSLDTRTPVASVVHEEF